jgi:hypothetical protein
MIDVSCVVFFSHSSADREWVQHLAHQARASGVKVYLAEHDVKPGERLSDKVVNAIETSNAMVVLLSRNSLQSVYVQQEIGVAHHAGKVVIPILMDDAAGSDLGLLNDREYIRLDPSAPGDALARLSTALGRLLEHQQAQLAKELAAKQSRDEALIVAGGVLLILGLVIISQGGQ